MKIQYASDLHLEFSSNKDYIHNNPIIPSGDILILNGDIINFSYIHYFQEFFDYLSDNFKMTFWIPGNHEYYSFNINEKSGEIFEHIRGNVILANDTSVIVDDVKFILSTLWSKISTFNSFLIEKTLKDFRVINYNDKKFNVEQYNQLHENSINFIYKEIKRFI